MAGAALFALRLYADELTEVALVPTTEFVEQAPLEVNAYQDPDLWFSRPGKGALNDPARWQPTELVADEEEASAPLSEEPIAGSTPPDVEETTPEDVPPFAVFFVHPTSYLERSHWNAPLDHEESQRRARLMVRGMASAFNQASEIWAPRYRQATFGAFLTDAPEAQQALDSAYQDIDQAFTVFLDTIGEDTPVVLAGHSQGGYHIARLLAERIVGTPLQDRIALAYPIGWPLSIEHDLPSLALPACETADQAGCIVSWVSFAEPATPGLFLKRYAMTPGFDDETRGESAILCVNPLTGTVDGQAAMTSNLGTLVPNNDLTDGELVPGAVPARCAENGLLLIGDPPELGQYVLPGNNYHVYDIPLFWRNLQEDVVNRMRTWSQQP